MLITKNGKPAYVVQSAEHYEYQRESIALLKLLSVSEQSAHTQGLLSKSDVFDE